MLKQIVNNYIKKTCLTKPRFIKQKQKIVCKKNVFTSTTFILQYYQWRFFKSFTMYLNQKKKLPVIHWKFGSLSGGVNSYQSGKI